MIVIVPHLDLELKLITAQKKIIRQIFDINNQIISYSAMPLWIHTDFESLQQAKEKITGITILAPEYNEQKGCLVCPVEITSDDGIINGSLDFIHLHRHCEKRNDIAINLDDSPFPLPVKIFRLGECTSSKPCVFELSNTKWVKLT
jgi:hypothetical protein